MASESHGRAILRAYLNLRERPASPSRAIYSSTLRAGAAISLAERIRRYGRLSYAQLLSFAELGGVTEWELRLSLLPPLKDAGLVVFTGDLGPEVEIVEQVAVAAPLLEQCDQIWQACGPSDAEAAALESAELGAISPLARSDHQDQLERAGFPAALHEEAIVAAKGAGLLYGQHDAALAEEVLFSPYVWSTGALNIAEFINSLPPNEREVLMGVSLQALQHPGVSEDNLGASVNLLRGARRVGLIDATRVQTATNEERSFVFSPTLENQLPSGSTEVMHQRKLFTAHILYGHRFGKHGTGRIEKPVALVNALIRNGTIAPSTAAKTDYLLLQAAGIIRVDDYDTTRGQMHLIKQDVALDSLELLRAAVGGDESDPAGDFWLPGSTGFTTPERDRATIPEIQAGADAEALQSAVETLRQRLRGDDLF